MKYEHIWNSEGGRDGAIYGDYLFRFDSYHDRLFYSDAKGRIYRFLFEYRQ